MSKYIKADFMYNLLEERYLFEERMANRVQSSLLEPPFMFIVGALKTPVYLAPGIVAPISAPLDRLMNNGTFAESQSRRAELPHVEVSTFLSFAKFAIFGYYDRYPPVAQTSTNNYEIKPRTGKDTIPTEGIKRAAGLFLAFCPVDRDPSDEVKLPSKSLVPTLPLTLHAKVYIFAHEQCVVGLQLQSYWRLYQTLYNLPTDTDGMKSLVLLVGFVYGVPSQSEMSELEEGLKKTAGVMNVEESMQEHKDTTVNNGETCKELGLRNMVVSFAAMQISNLSVYEPFQDLLNIKPEISRDILRVLYGPLPFEGFDLREGSAYMRLHHK